MRPGLRLDLTFEAHAPEAHDLALMNLSVNKSSFPNRIFATELVLGSLNLTPKALGFCI